MSTPASWSCFPPTVPAPVSQLGSGPRTCPWCRPRHPAFALLAALASSFLERDALGLWQTHLQSAFASFPQCFPSRRCFAWAYRTGWESSFPDSPSGCQLCPRFAQLRKRCRLRGTSFGLWWATWAHHRWSTKCWSPQQSHPQLSSAVCLATRPWLRSSARFDVSASRFTCSLGRVSLRLRRTFA